MEIEEGLSRFNKINKTIITSADLTNQSSRQRSFFKEFGDQGLDTLLANAAFRLYEVMDNLFSKKSFFLKNGQDHFFDLYKDIVDYLQKNNIALNIVYPDVRYNDAPHSYKFELPAKPVRNTDGTAVRVTGYGCGKDMEVALSKAVGEFLERYYLSVYRQTNLISGTFTSLPKGTAPVDIKKFASFTEEREYEPGLPRWTNESVLSWEKVVRFTTNASALVPAQMVYWNYKTLINEPRIIESNTNGGGGFFSKEGAILSGLYELIQRDAFLIFWLNKISPPKIIPESVPDAQFQVLVQDAKRFGFIIHCLNITVDNEIPNFVVVIEDPTNLSPKFVIGAGTKSDPVAALRAAIEEAWAVYDWIRQRPYFTLPANYSAFTYGLVGREERLRLWANPEMEVDFRFLVDGLESKFTHTSFAQCTIFGSLGEELQHVAAVIESFGSGYEVYYHAIKNPILEKLRYHVVKVIVPQLIPLYLNEHMAPVRAGRLREVPKKIGYPHALSLNVLPHPFP